MDDHVARQTEDYLVCPYDYTNVTFYTNLLNANKSYFKHYKKYSTTPTVVARTSCKVSDSTPRVYLNMLLFSNGFLEIIIFRRFLLIYKFITLVRVVKCANFPTQVLFVVSLGRSTNIGQQKRFDSLLVVNLSFDYLR